MDLFVNCAVNILDLLIFSLLFCRFTRKKFGFTVKSVRSVLLCGIALGLCSQFLPTDIYKFIFYCCILLIIHLFYDDQIYNSFVLFMLITTYVIAIQIPTAVVVFVPAPYYIYPLIGQLFTLLITILIWWKVDISKVADLIIDGNLTIKCIFYTISIILFGTLIYFQFDAMNLRPYLVLYIMLICIAGLGLSRTESLLRQCSNFVPRKYHDMWHAVNKINEAVNRQSDLEKVRDIVNENLIEIGAVPFTEEENERQKEKIRQLELVKRKNMLEALSELECQSKKHDIEFTYNIHVYEETSLFPENVLIHVLKEITVYSFSQFTKIHVDIFVHDYYGINICVCCHPSHEFERTVFKKGGSLHHVRKLLNRNHTMPITKWENGAICYCIILHPYDKKNALRRALC